MESGTVAVAAGVDDGGATAAEKEVEEAEVVVVVVVVGATDLADAVEVAVVDEDDEGAADEGFFPGMKSGSTTVASSSWSATRNEEVECASE